MDIVVSFAELPLIESVADKLGGLNIDFAFQPIFKKQTMERVGYEALMRPVGCTPLQMIETYSLKGGLHTLELATFFGAAKAYYDRNLTGMISINSFPSECFDEEENQSFYECFPEIAKDLFVEILEYTDLDLDKWIQKRNQIRSAGARISVDDFGTGNNHMMAVNVYSPNEVKIDRSIIKDIHKDEEKQNFLCRLIDQFHEKNINVLAEGVECKEEFDYLMTTDVDYLQGYYLGRPD